LWQVTPRSSEMGFPLSAIRSFFSNSGVYRNYNRTLQNTFTVMMTSSDPYDMVQPLKKKL